MWDLYLAYYGAQYEKQTGRPATDEVYARLWNGGPDGWRKSSTLKYWGRVRAVLEAARPESARETPGRDAIQIVAGNPPAAPFHLPSPFPPTALLVLPAEDEDRAAEPAVDPDAERVAAADAEDPS
jgi:hypothetical protein